MFLEVQTGHIISLSGHTIYFPELGARKPDKGWCIDLINNNAYSHENTFQVVRCAFKSKENRDETYRRIIDGMNMHRNLLSITDLQCDLEFY